MIQIVALVCTFQAPLRCKDVNLTFLAESVTPFQCFHYGQVELAKWAAEHPMWRVARFRCGRAGTVAKI